MGATLTLPHIFSFLRKSDGKKMAAPFFFRHSKLKN